MRLFKYIVINGVYLALIVGGGFYDIGWAYNLAAFSTWLLLFVAMLMFLYSTAPRWDQDTLRDIDMDPYRRIKKRGRTVPAAVDSGYDFVCMFLLAASGHPLLAVVCLMTLLTTTMFWSNIEEYTPPATEVDEDGEK